MSGVPDMLQEAAELILGQQASLDEARVIYSEIKRLGKEPGWERVAAMIEAQVVALRTRFEKPMEPMVVSHLQGQIEALRWLARLPGLADVMLFSVSQQQTALDAEKEEFVQTGA